MSVWADQSFTRTSVPTELIGSAAGRYQSECYWGRDCFVWYVHNWFSFAYSGCPRCCKPDGSTKYENVDVWPADFCTADPWRFIEVGRNFSTDERWLHTTWGREIYLITAATSDVNDGEGFDWLGALGTIFMIDVSPDGYASSYLLHAEALGYGLSRKVDLSSTSLYPFDTNTALNCALWADEGSSTAMMHDQQIFAFWQRGVAYFASYVKFPSNTVEPRIRLCHFGGVVEISFDAHLSSITPVDHSNEGSAMYKSEWWQRNAEAIPPGAVAHAMAADGRVEADGPLIYHAIIRHPFFPTGACPESFQRDLSCAAFNVSHVVARWSFAVTPSTGEATLLRPPSVILARSVSWYGKWVEGRRHSFYVLGDEVVRFSRPGAFESGIGGVESGRIRLQPDGWSPTLQGWYSVPAAVYKSGSLFIVRELHTASNTKSYPWGLSDFDAGPIWMLPSSRLRKLVWRSRSTHLIKVHCLQAVSLGC
eukprot:tig00020805_g14009.t1